MAQKILVVDDEPNILLALSDRLKLEGYDVVSAIDGASGIELAEKEKPDIMILDIMLPDMDGFKVCEAIKGEKKLDIKIVMATSKIDAVDVGKAMQVGADDFTVKTADFAAVLGAIKKFS